MPLKNDDKVVVAKFTTPNETLMRIYGQGNRRLSVFFIDYTGEALLVLEDRSEKDRLGAILNVFPFKYSALLDALEMILSGEEGENEYYKVSFDKSNSPGAVLKCKETNVELVYLLGLWQRIATDLTKIGPTQYAKIAKHWSKISLRSGTHKISLRSKSGGYPSLKEIFFSPRNFQQP